MCRSVFEQQYYNIKPCPAIDAVIDFVFLICYNIVTIHTPLLFDNDLGVLGAFHAGFRIYQSEMDSSGTMILIEKAYTPVLYGGILV